MSALTETEARTKLCPLVKSKIGSAEPEHHTNCIASDCMAWRWAREPDWIARKEITDTDEIVNPTRGYCGAFGAV